MHKLIILIILVWVYVHRNNFSYRKNDFWGKESEEPDYDEDKDQLEGEQEEEAGKTTNKFSKKEKTFSNIIIDFIDYLIIVLQMNNIYGILFIQPDPKTLRRISNDWLQIVWSLWSRNKGCL